jgi:hypothetical protein
LYPPEKLAGVPDPKTGLLVDTTGRLKVVLERLEKFDNKYRYSRTLCLDEGILSDEVVCIYI